MTCYMLGICANNKEYMDVFKLENGIIYNEFTKEKVDQLPTEKEYRVFKVI